jgi:ABC-type transport system involved in cytochrome c biogenesis permease component
MRPRLLPRNSLRTNDLRIGARAGSAPFLLVGVTVGFALVVLAFMLLRSGVSSAEAARSGAEFLRLLAICQLGSMLLITGLATRQSFQRERCDGTWEMLLVSPVSSLWILWGKLCAVALFVGWMLTMTLPFFGAALIFGSVPWQNLVGVEFLILVASSTVSATVMLVTIWSGRRMPSLIAVVGVPLVISVPAFGALQSVLPETVRVGQFAAWPSWDSFAFVSVALAVSLIVATSALLRPSASEMRVDGA